jgi:putative hemolysin
MLSRTPPISPRWLQPIWPSGRSGGLWPALCALSGHSVAGHRSLTEPIDRFGALEVRFARNAAEVRAAQRIRYQVFYRERGARPGAASRALRRDVDAFDAICDHLLVLDDAAAGSNPRKSAVVGTYRLLRAETAARHGGFYSAGEFDVSALVARHPGLRFLELGRSCVLAPYRNKRTMELLWHGIGAYTTLHRPDVMIGCASLDGTDPDRLAPLLSFLHHHAQAPEPWRTYALADRHIEMNRMPKERVDTRAALRELPPLIKAYLRLGAYVGDGAVIDRQFGTTDVLIVLRMSRVAKRYYSYFGGGEPVTAAAE